MLKLRKHESHISKLLSFWKNVPKMWKGWSLGKCVVDLLGLLKAEGGGQKGKATLSYTEGDEFLEVISMDQRAGEWLVEEGGSSSKQSSSCRRCRGG